jgi:hypothetical protein
MLELPAGATKDRKRQSVSPKEGFMMQLQQCGTAHRKVNNLSAQRRSKKKKVRHAPMRKSQQQGRRRNPNIFYRTTFAFVLLHGPTDLKGPSRLTMIIVIPAPKSDSRHDDDPRAVRKCRKMGAFRTPRGTKEKLLSIRTTPPCRGRFPRKWGPSLAMPPAAARRPPASNSDKTPPIGV